MIRDRRGGARAVVTGALSALLLASACADDPKRPPVADDGPATPGVVGGSGGGSPADADAGADAGDAGACTDLPNTGALVDQNAINEPLPAGTGGEVTDGIYDLTVARLYQGPAGLPGPTGVSFQGTIRLTGQSYERVLLLRSSAGASSETRSAGTFTPSGINGTITLTCPTAAQEQVTYSVLAEALTVSNLITKESFVFTKRL